MTPRSGYLLTYLLRHTTRRDLTEPNNKYANATALNNKHRTPPYECIVCKLAEAQHYAFVYLYYWLSNDITTLVYCVHLLRQFAIVDTEYRRLPLWRWLAPTLVAELRLP